MAWIIAKVSDHSVIEVSNKIPDFTLGELQTVIPINYGGSSSDYSYYQLSVNEISRIKDKDEYTLTWVGNNITAISFAVEDAKKWLRLTADKIKAKANGNEKITVTAKVLLYDKSGVDTSYNGTIVATIHKAKKTGYIQFDFINGVCSKDVKTNDDGDWVIPVESKHITDESSVSIRVDPDYRLNLKLITL
jgi:hypothetical protein